MTRDLVPPRVALVWAGLVGATLLSWWLGAEHGISNVRTASVVVLVVAFAKVRFVGLHFMDLRSAPPALRGAFEAWCLTVALLVIVLYLYA
jgi:hypothetical protein